MAKKNSSLISALVAGPIVIGIAYGVSALLTGGDAASETADAGIPGLRAAALGRRADRVCRSLAAARWHTQIFHEALAKLSRVAGKRL